MHSVSVQRYIETALTCAQSCLFVITQAIVVRVGWKGDSDCQNTITNVVIIVCCPDRDRGVPHGEGRTGRETLVHYDGRRSVAVVTCRHCVADCLTTRV